VCLWRQPLAFTFLACRPQDRPKLTPRLPSPSRLDLASCSLETSGAPEGLFTAGRSLESSELASDRRASFLGPDWPDTESLSSVGGLTDRSPSAPPTIRTASRADVGSQSRPSYSLETGLFASFSPPLRGSPYRLPVKLTLPDLRRAVQLFRVGGPHPRARGDAVRGRCLSCKALLRWSSFKAII
jgi:hypothetical protein